jgi:radical SAM superfamily enzyme YgiQ (UPF0313 family)
MSCIGQKSTIKIVWISFGEWRGYWFSALGIHTIAGYISKNFSSNLDQSVWYYDKKDLHNLIDCLVRNVPDYICFSVNIGYFKRSLRVADQIQNNLKLTIRKQTRFVFGNREFFNNEQVKMVLDAFPDSLVIKGEGEEPILRILNCNSFDSIPNLYYKKDENIFYTYDKKFNADDYVAPSYEIKVINKFNLELNQHIAYVEVSRGCSKKPPCTFCTNSAYPQKWRILNLPEVIKGIKKAAEKRPIAINFVSEDFLGENTENIEILLDHLERMRLSDTISSKTSFYCALKTTDIYSARESDRRNDLKKALLSRMRKLKFKTLYVGFESGSNSQLRRYGKRISREENIEAIKVLRSLQIHIDGGFITFDPLMNIEDCMHNISFLETADVPKLLLFPFNRLKIIPYTYYYYLYEKRKDKVDCKIKKLLQVIDYIDSFIPYNLFELFLQRLRLHYLSNGKENKIQSYESILRDYGILTLPFLRNLVDAFSKSITNSKIDQLVIEFLERHNVFSNRLNSFLREEEPKLFASNEIPEFKDTDGKWLG